MKNNIIKNISIFLCVVFLVTFIKTKDAYAYINTSSNWAFGILAIGDAKRTYFVNDGSFTCDPVNMKEGTSTGGTYNINTKEVALITQLTANYYNGSYVRVDDVYIGNSNDSDILKDFYQKGNSYFDVIVIKNLTPGKHKIEVREDRPFDLTGNPAQKIDYLYVNIPVFEDAQILESISKINSGKATLKDYDVVGIDGINQDNLNKVNEMTLGKNFDASNVQASVTEMLNQINSEIKLKDAFRRINSGVGILSDYTTIGVINVTSSNLNGVNALVKSERDIKNVDLTKDEIQGLVDNLPNMIDDANTRISEGTSTLVDYVLVGITGITDINLADVNEYVRGKDNSTKSKLQTNVITIVNALSYINNGTTSLSYYTTLGITTVTADNSSVVKQNILTTKNTKGNNLTKSEIKKVVEDSLENITDAYTRINAGTATRV